MTKKITLEDNIAIVDTHREAAMNLPADAVREPDMAVSTFIDELTIATIGAQEHREALAAVGMTDAMLARLLQYLTGLQAAQMVWLAERSRGRDEANVKLIEQCDTAREDYIAAAVLALRNNREGQHRLDAIREGEGLPDLVEDMGALAVLMTDARPLFEAININVDEAATKAAMLGKQLGQALAQEDVAKSLSNSKEMRDRIYTLTKEALKEVRMFAAFAFRKDKTNARRGLFTSAFLRRKNRRYKNARAAQVAMEAAAIEAAPQPQSPNA